MGTAERADSGGAAEAASTGETPSTDAALGGVVGALTDGKEALLENAAAAASTEPRPAVAATPGGGTPRKLTHATMPSRTALEATMARGKGLADGPDGALERGIARVAGSSTTAGGLEEVEPSSSDAASGGTLAILRVHSTRSSRAANVRVIGAPTAGVAGVSGSIGGVVGVAGDPGG